MSAELDLIQTTTKTEHEPVSKAPSHKYSFQDKMVIFIILLLMFISTASDNMLIPSYPRIIENFGIPPSKVFIPDSIATLVQAVVMILWGYYTDKLDRNKVIHAGVFVSTIGFIFTTFCTSYNQLLIARILSGAGLGFAIPIGVSILMDVVPPESRSGWFGFLALFSSISNATGQGLAAFLGPLNLLGNSHYGWQFPFLVLSGFSLIAIVLLAFVKLPDIGSQEEDLAELQKFEELQYGFKINRKEFLEILKKKTNKYLIVNGFFCIIPGTIMIYTLITTFADPNTGLLRDFPEDIVTQTATILGALVGIGYNVGNLVISYLSDEYNKKDKRNRARIAMITTALAIPFTLGAISMLVPVSYNEIGQPDGIFSAVIAIFKYKPVYIGYLILAFFGSFMGSGYVSNKRAIMVDVNLPEHRGTASSLFRLTEQLGKSLTLMMVSGLLSLLGSYINMIRIGILFWIPSVILWYLATRSVLGDMEEKARILRERQQTTFIDYFFELEILIDGGIQMVQDAKDILMKNPQKAKQRIEKAIERFEFINKKAKKTVHLFDIDQRSQDLLQRAMIFRNDLEEILQNPEGINTDDLKLLYEKIDESWEESDFGKIEILYDDAYLRVCEARLRRNYNPIESSYILKKAIEIYDRVVRLCEDRLSSIEERGLTPDDEEFEKRVAELQVLATKSKANTELLKKKLDEIVETIMEKDIKREELIALLDLTTEYGLKLRDIVKDTFGGITARRIERAMDEIDKLFDAYDEWMQKE